MEGGRVCGVGEQVIRGAMVVKSANLIRIRTWTWRGCGGAWFGGGCCDAMRGSSFVRQVVVR